MKITVIGLGYVGLSMAVLLSQKNDVIGCDINDTKVDLLKKKISPIQDDYLSKYIGTHDLNVVWDTSSKHYDADFIVIALPTNYDETTHYFDVSIIENVLDDIVSSGTNATIVIKSTVPIGFTKHMIETKGYDNILFCPEFLREGKALYDNLYPSRIIVGRNKSLDNEAKTFARLLAEAAIKEDIDISYVGLNEAEAVKLFSNTYLALRIAYFNEIDNFCIKNNLSTNDIIRSMSYDTRIGNYYNNPSFGYGGYCLPKDSKQMLANFAGIPQATISASVESNKLRKEFIANNIYETWLALETKKPICIYRLTMKSGSDNFREAAISDIIEKLSANSAPMVIYEPMIEQDSFNGIEVIKTYEDVANKCSMIVANRMTDDIKDLGLPIYTRDIYNRD